MFHRFYILLLILLMSSCATVDTVDPSLRRAAANISIIKLDDIGPRKYLIITEVMGLSCARQAGSFPSIDAAREKTKIEAAKVSADALLNVICEESGTDWVHNCWKTIQCRGDAIKWQ